MTYPLASIQGFIVRESDLLTVIMEDWSGVRSVARARRRRAMGHPQRIRIYWVPNPEVYIAGRYLIGHPATIAKLRAEIAP